MTAASAVEVVQVDRDAAAQRLSSRGMAHHPIQHTADMIRSGKFDDHLWVQAFARHRTENPELVALRAALNGWKKLHDEMVDAGGSLIPLPDDLIQKFSVDLRQLMDTTNAALGTQP